MDKQTLSNYGWIVVLILILVVLMALAGPFGNFVADGIKATTVGFYQTSEKGLQSAKIQVASNEWATETEADAEPTVIFHANNPETNDEFRTFYINNEKVNSLTTNPDGTITPFYDIPTFDYETYNNYIFKGWYLDKDNNNDNRPIDWSTKYTESTDIYAHWITVGDINKDANDGNNTSSYHEFEIYGVQHRVAQYDESPHYGSADRGLRFVAVLSKNVYGQINNINSANSGGAEYGFVIAKTTIAQKYAGNTENYLLQYKDTNVNGKDTSTDYKYVQNIKCSGVPDHNNYATYRIYTMVMTYTNLTGDALESAAAQYVVARPYIKYTDANGLIRYYYNNCTKSAKAFGGYSACYNDVR